MKAKQDRPADPFYTYLQIAEKWAAESKTPTIDKVVELRRLFVSSKYVKAHDWVLGNAKHFEQDGTFNFGLEPTDSQDHKELLEFLHSAWVPPLNDKFTWLLSLSGCRRLDFGLMLLEEGYQLPRFWFAKGQHLKSRQELLDYLYPKHAGEAKEVKPVGANPVPDRTGRRGPLRTVINAALTDYRATKAALPEDYAELLRFIKERFNCKPTPDYLSRVKSVKPLREDKDTVLVLKGNTEQSVCKSYFREQFNKEMKEPIV